MARRCGYFRPQNGHSGVYGVQGVLTVATEQRDVVKPDEGCMDLG